MAYEILKLGTLLEMENGEAGFSSMAAKFSCPHDNDLEDFLQNKAVPFERQGLSRTSLVYANYKGSPVLVGYYALAVKLWNVRRGISKSKVKEITGFKDHKSAPIFLIGQLSKNYFEEINKKNLIDGHALLGFAFKELSHANYLVGGRVVMVECRDKPYLREFYERYGFRDCGCDPDTPHLIQYIRRLSGITIE